MKKTFIAAAITIAFANPAFSQDASLADEQDKFSYALGMLIGENLKGYGDINKELLIEAINAHHSGEETKLTMEEAGQALQIYQQQLAAEAATKTKEAGEAYLAENAKRDGVTVTESGLQWEVLQEAEGDKPTADDTVSVHYVGTLIDGSEFDSSIARGQPTSFPVKGVIPGWTEGLQLMNVGSKYRFVIPSDLAYGQRGAGQAIGPGETLVFEVELLEIKQ
ncbi:MAG: FKBP-type peptidyl-prolyl cis-trans isomerase [Gammaproteobacteria bacterium]|nr:FKBP-type peptidyl-prolyl cis-trans isomerase [Gammaproteobacteria bacterium]